MVTDDSCGLEAITANIIIAYVRNNHLPGAILPDLIKTVHQALLSLGTGTAPSAPESARPTPAEVRKSITPDALISFIDGRPYKTQTFRRNTAMLQNIYSLNSITAATAF